MPELEPIEARPAVRIARPADPSQETSVRFAPLAPIASFLSGPIFTRTRDIVAANMAELLDRSEDPARMIRMIIVEMEETLVEVRATAARSIADIKEMRRAEALGLSGPKSLEEEIAELRSADAVDAELEMMKAALAAKA